MYEIAAYKASRLAVKFSPPTLFLEYIDAQRHVRVRAVKLSNISQATDPEYLTRKVIKGFPRGLDLSTVNTQQVTQLLQQLIDHSFRKPDVRRSGSGRRRSSTTASSSGNGQAPTCSTVGDPEAAAATCFATRALNCSRSCHNHHQQQQQPAASTVKEQQQPAEQHACTASCSGPGTSCSQEQHQCNSTTAPNQQQQQQQHTGLAGADSAAKHSMDTRLDGSAVSSVTTLQTASQQQQQQQHSKDSSNGVETCLSHSDKEPNGSTQAASGASGGAASPPGADAQPAPAAQAPAADTGSVSAPPHSNSSSSSAAIRDSSGEDDDDDDDGCLVLEPDFVTADGCEVDLNKVSDYELRLAKAQMNAAFQQNQLRPGDAGYVYDKQADFAPVKGANDWDDEE